MDEQALIATLNQLIETSRDGELGFRTCAEHASSAELKLLFRARAEDCRQAGAELQALVVQQGGTAEDRGSIAGALHRGWLATKGALTGFSDAALLEEAERGEDVALAHYRQAMEQALTPDVHAVVSRQLQGVLRNHEQVRELRNQARALASR